jgi:hypothetical protein
MWVAMETPVEHLVHSIPIEVCATIWFSFDDRTLILRGSSHDLDLISYHLESSL